MATKKDPTTEKKLIEQKVQKVVEKVEKEIKAEAKKEVKEVKAEARKEIKELETENEKLMKLLLSTLEKNKEESGKRDVSLIISIISFTLNLVAWSACFYFMLTKS